MCLKRQVFERGPWLRSGCAGGGDRVWCPRSIRGRIRGGHHGARTATLAQARARSATFPPSPLPKRIVCAPVVNVWVGGPATRLARPGPSAFSGDVLMGKRVLASLTHEHTPLLRSLPCNEYAPFPPRNPLPSTPSSPPLTQAHSRRSLAAVERAVTVMELSPLPGIVQGCTRDILARCLAWCGVQARDAGMIVEQPASPGAAGAAGAAAACV